MTWQDRKMALKCACGTGGMPVCPAFVRVLALDGGGVYGLTSLRFLACLEENFEALTAGIFDVFAGVSVGGLLALALTLPANQNSAQPAYTAREIRDAFVRHAGKAFQRSAGAALGAIFPFGLVWRDLFFARYDARKTKACFSQVLGAARMYDAVRPIFVPVYAIKTTAHGQEGMRVLTRQMSYSMAQVAMATCAAPTYFSPQIMWDPFIPGGSMHVVDGGVAMNNPSLMAYAHARHLYPCAQICLLSLGGYAPTPMHHAAQGDDGALGWLKDVPRLLTQSRMYADEYLLTMLLRCDRRASVVRVQPDMPSPGVRTGRFDDTTPAHLHQLDQAGYAMFQANMARVRQALLPVENDTG